MPTKTLVTGAAGFIGFHTALRLLERGENVVGVDNMNAYYDVKLKEARLALLEARPNFKFYRKSGMLYILKSTIARSAQNLMTFNPLVRQCRTCLT